jgi:hypothetical protein
MYPGSPKKLGMLNIIKQLQQFNPTLLEEYKLSHNDKRQGNSLIQFISFNNTFDHYIGSQYKDMRISRLVILIEIMVCMLQIIN